MTPGRRPRSTPDGSCGDWPNRSAYIYSTYTTVHTNAVGEKSAGSDSGRTSREGLPRKTVGAAWPQTSRGDPGQHPDDGKGRLEELVVSLRQVSFGKEEET